MKEKVKDDEGATSGNEGRYSMAGGVCKSDL